MADALKGKVAVITGGASGIGQATAVRFAEEGADIVIGDLQDGSETIKLVEKAGRKAIYVKTDTTSEADNDALVAAGVKEFGHVDVGVAAAGIASVVRGGTEQDAGHVINMVTADFAKVIEINVIGVMQTDRALAQQMLKQGTGGSIINIASTAAKIPLPGAAPYCTSKAGCWMLTKVMALELAETGIRVNAVGPGYTRTPMWDVEMDESTPGGAHAKSITPMHRNGTPQEQAAAILFLASDESSFFTGQILHPAGGQFTD